MPAEVIRENILPYIDPETYTSLSKVCKKFYNMIWNHETSYAIPGNNFKKFLADRYIFIKSKIFFEKNINNIIYTLATSISSHKKLSKKSIESCTKKFMNSGVKISPFINGFISLRFTPLSVPEITNLELLTLVNIQENPIFQSAIKKVEFLVDDQLKYQISQACNNLHANDTLTKIVTEALNDDKEKITNLQKAIISVTPTLPVTPGSQNWFSNFFSNPTKVFALNATILCIGLFSYKLFRSK